MIKSVQSSDELIADFQGADNVTGAIHVWNLGGSCFLIKWNGHGLLMDPYLSDSLSRSNESDSRTRASDLAVNPLKLKGIDLVTCCNAQPDHLDSETLLALRTANPGIRVVVPQGVAHHANEIMKPAGPPLAPVNSGTYIKSGPFQVHALPAANPDFRQDTDGNSLDVSYVISFGPFIVFHAGDTLWHKTLVREVRRWPINLAFLPINGEDGERDFGYNMNGFEAAAFAKAISTSLVVPCHYDLFEENNVTTEEFENCCDRLHQRYRILELGQRMTMGPVTDPSSGKGSASEEYRGGWGLGY